MKQFNIILCMLLHVYTGTIDPDQHLYMRVKNVLENTSASFELDYLEYAPKHVYSGAEAEDIW